jgi:GNAT superfamily N-acetyltransferase
VEIRILGYDHPDAELLTAEVQQEYVRRYGDPDLSHVDPAHFRAPAGLYALGYLDGEPMVSGGWRAHADRLHDGDGLLPGDVELKRMYTRPAARGRGLARRMLRFLEEEAAKAGLRRMILETGTEQPEAIALYESEGYERIPGFGYYAEAPGSVCFGKLLDARVGCV